MISENLKKIRGLKGMSQRKLSRQSGVSVTYINRIEKGIYTNPSIEVLEKMAKALDVKAEDLTANNTEGKNSKSLSNILNNIYNNTSNNDMHFAATIIKKLIDNNLLNDDGSMSEQAKKIIEEAVKLEAQVKKLNEEKKNK